jgi:hypothetical protein
MLVLINVYFMENASTNSWMITGVGTPILGFLVINQLSPSYHLVISHSPNEHLLSWLNQPATFLTPHAGGCHDIVAIGVRTVARELGVDPADRRHGATRGTDGG